MYLTALLTKWRDKNIRFTFSSIPPGKFELVAEMLGKQRYVAIITDDLKYACKMLDAGLTKRMEELKLDNNHLNS